MWVGWVSSVHAQGPYKHLTPDNPDFERKVQVQCFLLFVFFFFRLFQPRLSGKKSFLKSSVGRQSFGFSGEGNEETGPPFSSPLRSLVSSLLGEQNVSPLSFTPRCWQTGQTSWVGPWCQWVGTAAEVKRHGGEGGRETHNRVSFLTREAFGGFFLLLTLV